MQKSKELVPKPRSRFLRIKCLNCGSEQVVFGCATIEVKCNVCEKQLVQSTGGKARVLTKISEVLSYTEKKLFFYLFM
jgi:small subunit ribosomal protein S27e